MIFYLFTYVNSTGIAALVFAGSFLSEDKVLHAHAKYPLVFSSITGLKWKKSELPIQFSLNSVTDLSHFYSKLCAVDRGFLFLRMISKAEATELLASCPLGTFVIRPCILEGSTARQSNTASSHHQEGAVFHLSFRGLLSEGIKHATIRIDSADNIR